MAPVFMALDGTKRRDQKRDEEGGQKAAGLRQFSRVPSTSGAASMSTSRGKQARVRVEPADRVDEENQAVEAPSPEEDKLFADRN